MRSSPHGDLLFGIVSCFRDLLFRYHGACCQFRDLLVTEIFSSCWSLHSHMTVLEDSCSQLGVMTTSCRCCRDHFLFFSLTLRRCIVNSEIFSSRRSSLHHHGASPFRRSRFSLRRHVVNSKIFSSRRSSLVGCLHNAIGCCGSLLRQCVAFHNMGCGWMVTCRSWECLHSLI